MLARLTHRLLDGPLRLRARRERSTQSEEDLPVALIASGWLVALKAPGQLVGVVEDVLDAARHDDHLKNLSRARMAWTTTGPVAASTTPIS